MQADSRDLDSSETRKPASKRRYESGPRRDRGRGDPKSSRGRKARREDFEEDGYGREFTLDDEDEYTDDDFEDDDFEDDDDLENDDDDYDDDYR